MGFQFAFRPLHFVTAWLLTLFTGYLLPMAIVFFIRLIGGNNPLATWLGLSFFTLYQLALALACYRRLKRTLDDRTFTMHLG